jgi:transposase
VLKKARAGAITWHQAAQICGVTPRQMRRLRARYEERGVEGLRDGRHGRRQPRRVPRHIEDEVCRLKKDVYSDFSIRHFHEFVVEQHGIDVSYSWTRKTLLAHGLAYRADGRGKYRRRRPRRPMTGMLLHLDASTHRWIEGQPMHDLVVMLDDADGRILFARFFVQETTLSTLAALKHVLERHGRFCELYSDRASHFCHTTDADDGPDAVQNGTVPSALKTLGIRQILARSPQARGRSERAFGTIQGRLPQELRLLDINNFHDANDYLERHFVPDFNERFTVEPAQPETAFVPLKGVELELLLSVHYERVVRNDNTVLFRRQVLQLWPTEHRLHFVRCKVLVHEFPDETLGVSHNGILIGRFGPDARDVPQPRPRNARHRCAECVRKVRHDHTVLYDKLVLSIPPAVHRPHFVGCDVAVHEYDDGIIDICHEGLVIGRYNRNSNRIRRRALRYKRKSA